MNREELADLRRKANPWVDRRKATPPKKQQTVEEFLAEGGKVTKYPNFQLDRMGCSKRCCDATFEQLI